MFAGPHLEPWLCTTEAAGLGPATDADCDAPTQTTWSYQATDGGLKPLADPASIPADVASTTVGGASVPFVIRTEQGVIDRGIYTIWTLDPKPNAAAGAAWDASGWNRRLVYRFGGGCGTLVHAGLVVHGRRRRRPARQRLRGRDQHPRHAADDVQHRALCRSRADDARALRRGLRRAEVHHRRRWLRRRDPAAHDRAHVSGHPRRAVAEPAVPGRGLDRGGCHRLRIARPLLQDACRSRAHGRAEGRDQRAPHVGHVRVLEPVVRRRCEPDRRVRCDRRRRVQRGQRIRRARAARSPT